MEKVLVQIGQNPKIAGRYVSEDLNVCGDGGEGKREVKCSWTRGPFLEAPGNYRAR